MKKKLNALQFEQNNRSILLLNMSAGDLKAISYFNTRDIDREDGLQRAFDNKRSKAIAEFLSKDDAILGKRIIINLELEKNNLSVEDIFKNGQFDIGKLINKVSEKKINSEHEKIAFVVDGQHRLRAFEQVQKDKFKVPVTALIDLSLAEAAELFVQINYNQKPVNKSHVFDLLGISENIFPKYFILHKAVLMLQEESSSPFYNKVKMLGVGKGFISQASLITALEKYKIQKVIEDYCGTCNEEDIFNVMWNFFKAVESSFPKYWGEKLLLSKTVGIRALIRTMIDLLIDSFERNTTFSRQNLIEQLEEAIGPSFFDDEKFEHLIGEKGVTTLYNAMKMELAL